MQDRPAAAFCGFAPRAHDFAIATATGEYFTVDLRAPCAALVARAARDSVTESDVPRSSLAAALGTSEPFSPIWPTSLPVVASRLDQHARAAGRSRGALLARLIQGARPVASYTDRAAACTTLNNFSDELSVMSRDINNLTQLLRQGSTAAAKSYSARHDDWAGQRQEIYASPLLATTEQLKGLPPALLQSAEKDVVHDEGEAYARKLDAAGVTVVATRYNGMIHDFGLLNVLSGMPATRAALHQASEELKTRLR